MIKLRNATDLSIDEVHCCYFVDGNLPVIDVKDLKITTCPQRLINIYESRRNCFLVQIRFIVVISLKKIYQS